MMGESNMDEITVVELSDARPSPATTLATIRSQQ